MVPCTRTMLFPDIQQGRLSAVKNRKHFFSDGTKVNDILPKIHKEYRKNGTVYSYESVKL